MVDLPVIPVLNADQAAAWDTSSIAEGIPSRVLMDVAGRTVAAGVVRECGDLLDQGVLVVAGHGNNGGDGWVAARALRALGIGVSVVEFDRERTPDCEANRRLAIQDGVPRLGPEDDWPRAGVIVDAILGTGATGAPRGEVGRLAQRIVDERAATVAIDGPTGLDLSTGEAHGPVRARVTVTFGGLRRGHLSAREWCGRILVAEIGFAANARAADWPVYVDGCAAASAVPRFSPSMHKGRRGRVVILGGEAGMAGAVHHAARAALASGAGLVRLVGAAASSGPLQENVPDATVIASELGPELEPDVADVLEWADVVIVGPGLGRSEARRPFVERILERVSCPAVLDADALQVGRERLFRGTGPLVITPHAGEFTALFPELAETAAADRYGAARMAVALLEGEHKETVLLMKGVPTVVTDGQETRVVGAGNPALATGGSGDVLSGIIGALAGRGASPFDAAAAGAYAMGRAAEIAAASRGVTVTRPADVVAGLGEVWGELTVPPRAQPPFVLDLEPPQLT